MRMVSQQMRCARRKQRGVAAIEFALVFMTLFLVMYALATFGAALYVQQAISRAAEDGARAAELLPHPPDSDKVTEAIVESLARSLIVPASANLNMTSRKKWVSDHIEIEPCTAETGAESCVVTVIYPYKDDARILPVMPLLDARGWIEQLQSSATAALRTS